MVGILSSLSSLHSYIVIQFGFPLISGAAVAEQNFSTLAKVDMAKRMLFTKLIFFAICHGKTIGTLFDNNN